MTEDHSPNDPTPEAIVRTLLVQLSRGKISADVVLPVIGRLIGEDGPELVPSVEELIDALASKSPDEDVRALVGHLREVRLLEIAKSGQAASPSESSAFFLQGLPSDIAPAWEGSSQVGTAISEGLRLISDWIFIRRKREECPGIAATVEEKMREAIVALREKLSPFRDAFTPNLLDLLSDANEVDHFRRLLEEEHAASLKATEGFLDDVRQPVPGNVNRDHCVRLLLEKYRDAGTQDERQQLLDVACGWPSCQIVPALLEMCDSEWARERALLLLTLRFGGGPGVKWPQWNSLLLNQWYQFKEADRTIRLKLHAHPVKSLVLWHLDDPELDSFLDAIDGGLITVDSEAFVLRWSQQLSPDEWNVITGYEGPTPPPLPVARTGHPGPPPLPQVTAVSGAAERFVEKRRKLRVPQPEPVLRPEPVAKPAPPPEPKSPTIWEQHVRPFFVENWYFVAGIAMVILGSSLLAYYTWDKHWLWRYTIMPALLALATAAFAGAGRWIASRGKEFIGTAAMLRGTAIALLPVNFMTMALVSNDPQVTQKVLLLSVMGLIYLFLAGWGLHRWCGAIHPKLARPLGGTLLLLNFLAALGPLANALAGLEGQSLLITLGTGFHLGFFVIIGAVIYFARHVLTAELAAEKQVPWFFGLTLGLTFVQVFAWVHGYLHHLPQVFTYAPMMILAGGLVLFTERRAMQLTGSPDEHRPESFVGYAFILLGILMGASQEYVRILCFALAGAIWIYQASPRRQAVHFWIALTLLSLAGASVGLLEIYPKKWLAAIGVVIGIGMSAGDFLSRKRNPQLAAACRGIQLAVFVLTVAVAVLTQWHFRTDPWATGVCLLAIVGFSIWSAVRNDELRWMESGMLVLALALPYLGLVDMEGRTLHGNKMVFGLGCVSALWIAVAWWFRRVRVIAESRSTVLWVYGSLAMVGMVLRVFLERGAPLDAGGLRMAMDYAGPFIMAIALVFAAYHSRSLVPTLMASVIVVILFPELKERMQEYLPEGFWGTGLGSSCSVVAMMLACVKLRSLPGLQNLDGGDRFLGRIEFPLRRTNHEIFTLPMVLSSLFLLAKLVFILVHQASRSWPELSTMTGAALLVAAVGWTLLAVFLRERTESLIGVHFAWIMLLAGFGVLHLNYAEVVHWTWPVLFTFLTLQVWHAVTLVLSKKWSWVGDVMTKQLGWVLHVGAVVLTLGFCVNVFIGLPMGAWWFIAVLIGPQLAWNCLQTRQWIYSGFLVALVWFGLNAWVTPGEGWLVERISRSANLMPNLWLVIAIQAVFLLLERVRDAHFEKLRPLSMPFLSFASAIAVVLGAVEAVGLVAHGTSDAGTWPMVLAVLGVALSARAQSSGFVALSGVVLVYVLVLGQLGDSLDERIELLLSPWRLAVFSLATAAITLGGQWLHKRTPRLLCGPFAQTGFRTASANWLYIPAIVVGALASAGQTISPTLREVTVQLWTPYLAAAAAVVTALAWRQAMRLASLVLATALFVAGNIHAVRLAFGETLLANGLSELHLICLGISASLLVLWLLRIPFRGRGLVAFFNQASLVLAGFVLVLLSANYFAHPQLAEVTSVRFVVSGLMALLAGLFFRRAARKPGPGEERYGTLCEAFYHFGVVLALWCAALVVPWMRRPETALAALAVPAFYFLAKAEICWRRQSDALARYRNTATVLSFMVLALYAFRAVLHLVMFPEAAVDLMHYHTNAPLVVLLALVLLRLHGLEGTEWLAFYGGLALILGSYFLLTWFPGLSPFTYPVPAAWCAVALGHFWIVASFERSPLRTTVQRLGGIDGAHWFGLRREWGYCVLALVHLAVAWGILDYGNAPLAVAPLLVAAATILIHQGIIRRSHLYFWIAFIEVVVALHAGFILESHLDKDLVIWALLVLWGIQLIAFEWLTASDDRSRLKPYGIVLMAVVLAHVIYHHPSSVTGLVAVPIAAVLAAFGRRHSPKPESPEEWVGVVLLPLVPVWLIYFGQAGYLDEGLAAITDLWPVMCALAVAFGIAILGGQFQLQKGGQYLLAARPRARLSHHVLWCFAEHGRTISKGVLWIGTVVMGMIVPLHYESAYTAGELTLGLILWGVVAAGWFLEMRRDESMAPAALLQAAVLGAFLMVRRQLMLTQDFWTAEYDVWVSLGISLLFAGIRDLVNRQSDRIRVPFVFTLCAMPVVALALVLFNNLGSDIALVVVGLHSLIFAYLGRGSKDSPYNAVATLGFVAFILLAFWTKLELRTVQAYVIPAGAGLLVLVQLFREHISPETRSTIRLITLLAMLGSTGYYAIVDTSYPVAFHLTMLLLCIAIMGLGGLMKIRIYLYLGFAGVMVDLCALGYRELVAMDRGVRMTIVGAMVLLIGIGLVVGAIYFKTHRDLITAKLEKWRSGSGGWS